ncbi:hypothetical protein L7F22_048293, partial [Adiantum nelumboides]|nr:hypothetical protein [Adiantum nelumboides]
MYIIKMQGLEARGFNLKIAVVEITNFHYWLGKSVQASKRFESSISMEAQILQHIVVKPNEHEKFVVETSTSQVQGNR